VLAQLQAIAVELGAEDVAGAAGMGEQVAHGDLGGHLLIGIAGQVLADGVVQGQLVRLDQLQGRDRGEHLVHRADPEPGRRRVRGPGLAVGAAPGVLEQHLAVAGDQHGPGELIRPGTLGGMGRERASACAWGSRCSTRFRALDGLGVASGSTRPSASPTRWNLRLSTPTRSGP
jgi:hypothetical protein